jgi:hypothetical protein
MLSRRLIALSAGVAVSVAAPAAIAATSHGITPVSPKAGGSVASGKAAIFKMRVKGPGQVWVHVCKRARKDRKGVICNKEAIFRAYRKKGTLFQGKAKYFDYDGFWLNTPGTYYWQAHRISCEDGNLNDCLQEGPVVRFKVV